MPNEYEILTGESPSSSDRAAEIASALRRRRSYGELGMLSGDRVLSGVGERLTRQADQYADRIQQTRQQDIDNAQTRRYQDGQLGHMGSVLQETIRNNNMQNETTRRGQDMSLEAARLRALNSKKPTKLTATDRRDLQQAASLVGNMRQLQGSFDDSYAGVTAMGMSIPGGRALSNTLSAAGYGTDAMDAAQKWWAESERLYTLFNRNKLFGATLTSNEMKAWADANASKNMKPKQIKEVLASVIDNAEKELTATTDYFSEAGYDPDQISAITQRGHEAQPGMGAEDEEPLTEEEMAELEELRAKHRGGSR